MWRRFAVGVALMLSAALGIHAQAPATHVEADRTEEFLARLEQASQAGDRNTVAAMIHYPVTVSIGGLRVPFSDAAAFVQRYDDIFTPALHDAIARRSTDVTVGTIDGQLRITGITVPQFTAAAESVQPPTDVPRARATESAVRRIAIRVGPRPTQIPGSLARNATDAFVLYLPKGRLAGVRLERIRAGAAVLRVVHARTGTPLKGRTSADGRYVTGRPAESGDYRIEVRRVTNTDEIPLPYMLSLTLR